MADRAVWKVARDDPRTSLGWLLAVERPRGLPLWVAGTLASIVIAFALAGNLWLLPALPLVALTIRRRRRSRDLSALVTSPPPGPAFVCRLEVRSEVNVLGEGCLLGEDEGIVTFVDGWLHFVGGRTEFALRRPDVQKVEPYDFQHTLFMERDRAISLRIADERDDDFIRRAFLFWSNGAPVPDGTPTMPPDAVHPAGLARAWRDALVGLAVILAGAGLMLSLYREFPYFLLFMGGGGATVSSLRRLKALRRLAREQALAARRAQPLPNDPRLPIGR